MHEADGVLRGETQALSKLQEERKTAMDEQIKIAEDKVEELQSIVQEINPTKLQQQQDEGIQYMKE